LRAREISVYRDGDLNGSVTVFDRAVLLEPKFLPAYIDPDIIFYRPAKFDGAFPGIAPAKASRLRSAPKVAPKPRLDQAAAAPSVKPSNQWRTAAQDPSRQEALAQMR
jgi:hypothetical protein